MEKKNVLVVFCMMLFILSAGYAVAKSRGFVSKPPLVPPSQTRPIQQDPQEPITNVEALAIANETTVIEEENVQYYPGAKGYFVKPEKAGNYPGIVMIHENRGLRPEIKDTAKQLAKEGYLVLAVDLYNGKVVETQEEARALSAEFNQEEGLANLKAGSLYLRQQGAVKVASLGWCFGGRQSVALAISGELLDATVVYYGGNMATTEAELKPISWPVLGVFGQDDKAIPIEKVNEFETSLNNLGIENEIYVYPGVGHAFANPSGANYAPRETLDAWEKTKTFLETHLK